MKTVTVSMVSPFTQLQRRLQLQVFFYRYMFSFNLKKLHENIKVAEPALHLLKNW